MEEKEDEEEKEDDKEKEKEDYFYRLICLVVDLGTEVLLNLFLNDIPQGQTVESFLNSKANVLKTLKKKKVFNDLQIGILDAAPPDESRFDISLLYILISNLTNIQSPTGGWYITCTLPSDQSAGAQLMNLRIIRNEAIAHWPKCKMKKSDFEKYWNEATDILIELAGEVGQADKDSVKEKIDIIKMKQLGDMGNKLESLLLWARQDQYYEILSSIGDLNKKIDQHGSVLGDIGPIKSSIQAVEAQINTTSNKHRRDNEEIKISIQTIADRLKTLLNQNRPIPGTSSGTESSVPEMTEIKNSHPDKATCAPDQEDEQYVINKNKGGDGGPVTTNNGGHGSINNFGGNFNIAGSFNQVPSQQHVPGSLNQGQPYQSPIQQKLRTEIMDHYKETGCCTTAVPALMDGEEVHIDEIFVMPSMSVRKNMAISRENVNQFTRKENEDVMTGGITTIHEIFQKEGKSIRRVCVSGDAGQGKTTLCRKIVSIWCKIHSNIETVPYNDYQFLKSFDLLLYLPLRNHKTLDVIEMVKTEIVRKASHNALKDFLEKESDKCLIILDGLDEWLPSEDCKLKVPFIDPREKYTVLITSRPWKLEILRPTMSEIGQEVELNGVENVKLIEAVVNFLNNKYAKERNWKDFKYNKNSLDLNETYEKVNHLAEIPIILTQMVCMWYDDEAFGNTHVEIYSQMVNYLFHVADKRRQKILDSAWMRPLRSTNTLLVKLFKDFKYCDMYSEILFKLSNLAYHSLFNEKIEYSLVFPHSVTEIYELKENDVKFCLFVGILSQTKCLGKASSQTKSISFLHKTFQEFLAAVYIAYGGEDRIVTIVLQTLKSLDDVFEVSQVLIFLSGLRPDMLGDMSRHIAQLTDKDDRVLQYRNSIREEHEEIIGRIQDIIYNCIVDVPEHNMLDNKVELHDVDLKKDDKVKKKIPYLILENVKSWYQIWDVPNEDWTNLNDLVKLGFCIQSQKDIDHVTSTVERFASSLTCLSFNFEEGILENRRIDFLLAALKKVSHLTCVKLRGVILTHSDIEYLGKTLSHSTQLKEIDLDGVWCRTCQWVHCNYRIDLSHHKQLQYLRIGYLAGDIVLSNEVPVECCDIAGVKCTASILDTLKSSTNLHELSVGSILTNSITSSTTTVQDGEMEVHPTPLCLYNVLTDVIPTLKNLRTLCLWDIDFKQDILRLYPKVTNLYYVLIHDSIMTLQCLQGFIDSLPQTQFIVFLAIYGVYIRPREDTSTALKYITDRHQITTEVIPSYMTKDGPLDLEFTNRPSH